MAWMRAICRFPGLKGFLIYGQRVSLLPRTNISPIEPNPKESFQETWIGTMDWEELE